MIEDRNFAKAGLVELEELLAIHGADRTRWPAPERRRFAGLLATDPQAQRLVREAAALDRLLDLAPGPGSERGALAERIVAAAAGAGADGARPLFEVARRRARTLSRWRSHSPALRALGAAPAPAAALLAASLLVGVVAGTSGALDAAFEPLAAVAVTDVEAEMDASRLAFGSDEAGLLEEDML